MAWYVWLMIIITAVIVVAAIGLYFLGKKAEKRKIEQDKAIAAAAQTVSMLIIDKKRVKLKDAGLPPAVLAQTPKYMRRAKTPVVKVKVGPTITTLLCAPEIFEDVPVKKEVKAVVSGLYLTAIKGQHGKKEAKEPKKEGFMQRMRKRAGM
ncbi:hypothetical protein SAMN02910358_00871 [Lachnospiraceae bacterium XBB1006]|nr:hypothetical protein SAMN02910358_00871 [Lachnospiraceae bacterium XBB1006]